jgi:hypothetical protein
MNVKSILLTVSAASLMLLAFGGVAGGASKPTLQAEVVYLRNGGFYPHAITRPAGQFVLVVVNRSGPGAIALSVKSALLNSASTAAASGDVSPAQSQSIVLNLAAGKYYVSDLNHPSWPVMTLTLQ